MDLRGAQIPVPASRRVGASTGWRRLAPLTVARPHLRPRDNGLWGRMATLTVRTVTTLPRLEIACALAQRRAVGGKRKAVRGKREAWCKGWLSPSFQLLTSSSCA